MTPLEKVLACFPDARRTGAGWQARCLAHEDHTASLSVAEGRDAAVLLHCHAGCATADVVAAAGLSLSDLFPAATEVRKIVANYPYTDADGRLLFEVVRFTPKGFAQRRPDGAGGWTWSLNGVERTLFRLPELRSADPERLTFVVEGERDADRLAALGLIATCNAGGAGRWRSEYADELRGRRVVVLPDADQAGRQHAEQVAQSLLGKAAEVRIVTLPDVPPKGDVSDWLDAGGTVDGLKKLIRAAPLITAEMLSAPPPRVPDGKQSAGPDAPSERTEAPTFLEPEDRGTATLSAIGEVEYVEDLIRPGRIVVWAAEEGSGKSFAVTGELAIRIAAAGGDFAATWPIVRQGPVLVLSEMHPDDDYGREEVVLASLGIERAALAGRYYRLPLMTAAGGAPALTVPEWRTWVADWARAHGVLLAVFDTATGATQVDPWGREIQNVYRDLRLMLDAYPDLAVVLIVHVKKPTGHGERRLSDVLGEWGRWCDVVVMQENDGGNLERAKITVRKRVRRERRIIATKSGGLLIDPVDATTSGPKVPAEKVLAAVPDSGITYAALGAALGVSKDTASRYVKALGDGLSVVPGSRTSPALVYPKAAAGGAAGAAGAAQASAVPAAARPAVDRAGRCRSTARTYIGAAGAAAVPPAPTASADEVDLTTAALAIFADEIESIDGRPS